MGSIADGRDPAPAYYSSEARAIEALALVLVATMARVDLLEAEAAAARAGQPNGPAVVAARVDCREDVMAALGAPALVVVTLAARGRR